MSGGGVSGSNILRGNEELLKPSRGAEVPSTGVPFSCDLQLDSPLLAHQAFWLSKNKLFDEEELKCSSKELAEIHREWAGLKIGQSPKSIDNLRKQAAAVAEQWSTKAMEKALVQSINLKRPLDLLIVDDIVKGKKINITATGTIGSSPLTTWPGTELYGTEYKYDTNLKTINITAVLTHRAKLLLLT